LHATKATKYESSNNDVLFNRQINGQGNTMQIVGQLLQHSFFSNFSIFLVFTLQVPKYPAGVFSTMHEEDMMCIWTNSSKQVHMQWEQAKYISCNKYVLHW